MSKNKQIKHIATGDPTIEVAVGNKVVLNNTPSKDVKKKEYVFNFKAIPTCEDSRGYGAKGVWATKAKSANEAIEKAREHFEENKQFKFEYQMA